MFKNIIAPIQAWLLSHGQCVGCGMPLSKGKVTTAKIKDHDQVTCKCGRIFMKNQQTGKYRRALFEEV
jgi:predicted nucleic acid-binding Zn ribbon protein